MTPTDLIAALQPMVGRQIFADTLDGYASFTVRAVVYLEPGERSDEQYDVLIQNNLPDENSGVVLDSENIRGVRFNQSGGCDIEHANGWGQILLHNNTKGAQ